MNILGFWRRRGRQSIGTDTAGELEVAHGHIRRVAVHQAARDQAKGVCGYRSKTRWATTTAGPRTSRAKSAWPSRRWPTRRLTFVSRTPSRGAVSLTPEPTPRSCPLHPPILPSPDADTDIAKQRPPPQPATSSSTSTSAPTPRTGPPCKPPRN